MEFSEQNSANALPLDARDEICRERFLESASTPNTLKYECNGFEESIGYALEPAYKSTFCPRKIDPIRGLNLCYEVV